MNWSDQLIVVDSPLTRFILGNYRFRGADAALSFAHSPCLLRSLRPPSFRTRSGLLRLPLGALEWLGGSNLSPRSYYLVGS